MGVASARWAKKMAGGLFIPANHAFRFRSEEKAYVISPESESLNTTRKLDRLPFTSLRVKSLSY
jgi:hypothetical protein